LSEVVLQKTSRLIDGNSPVQDIFRAYGTVAPDTALFEASLKDMLSSLKSAHHFALSENDESESDSSISHSSRKMVTFRSSQESPGYTGS